MMTRTVAPQSTWTAARRKSDGKPFFFVPSLNSDAVYMTAADACTCQAAQRSRTGDCKHQAAVRATRPTIREIRPAYADLFPECATDGCYEIAEFGSFCNRCASDREHAMNREARYIVYGHETRNGDMGAYPNHRCEAGRLNPDHCICHALNTDDTDDDAPPF